MKRYPVLILAYKRTTELELALNSLKQINPSIVYFHIHNAPENDIEGQRQVENVKKMIASYKGEKKVKYQKEPLGIRKSMYSALEWVSSEQEVFFVWEDDIVLNPNSEKTIAKYMARLEKEGGLLKLGEGRDSSVFWGWGATSTAVKQIINIDITSIAYENLLDKSIPKQDFVGLVEMYKRRRAIAWDDEFGFVVKILGINQILSDTTMTDHIGYLSTRTTIHDKGFGVDSHVTYINGVLMPQENDNA